MNAPFTAACDPLASARAFVAEAENRQMLADYAEAAMHSHPHGVAEMAPDIVLALLEIAERHERAAKALAEVRHWLNGGEIRRGNEICIPPCGGM